MYGCLSRGQGEAPVAEGSVAGASCFVSGGPVSVSLATRGQTDMRGLVTAGRAFRQECSACLEASVAP